MLRDGTIAGVIGLAVGLLLLVVFPNKRPIQLPNQATIHEVRTMAYDGEPPMANGSDMAWEEIVLFHLKYDGFDDATKTARLIANDQSRASAISALIDEIRVESANQGLVLYSSRIESKYGPVPGANITRIQKPKLSQAEWAEKTSRISQKLAAAILLTETIPDGPARADILNAIAAHYIDLEQKDAAFAASAAAIKSLNRAERNRYWTSILSKAWVWMPLLCGPTVALIGIGRIRRWTRRCFDWLSVKLLGRRNENSRILLSGVD